MLDTIEKSINRDKSVAFLVSFTKTKKNRSKKKKSKKVAKKAEPSKASKLSGSIKRDNGGDACHH